jgi:Putative ATPase subunit of terminase (gpP-like)
VDVPYAADLYAQGWTLRQITAELGRTETTVSDQQEHTRAWPQRPPRTHDTSSG